MCSEVCVCVSVCTIHIPHFPHFPFYSFIFRSTIIHAETSGGGVPAHAEGEGRTGQRGLQQSVDHEAGRSDDHINT